MAVAGCGHARPSAAAYPAPVASAAQPAAAAKGDIGYARRGAEAIRSALHGLEPEEAMTRAPRAGVAAAPDIVVSCLPVRGEPPVILCHYGPNSAQPVAQAIFWYEQEAWQYQFYPQAALGLAAERREALSELGCRIGCFGAIAQARLVPGDGGPELMVVVDLGAGGPAKAQEVQLLSFADGVWSVAWVPPAGDWNYGHAEVTLPRSGDARFQVRSSSWERQDHLFGYVHEPENGEHRWFNDRWERRGDGYFLRDRDEESSPYSTLLRAIHYLTTGADEKARGLLAPELELETARKALAQKPKRQSWKLARRGESEFMLETRGTGKPDRAVRLEQRNGTWVIAEVKELPDGAPAPSKP